MAIKHSEIGIYRVSWRAKPTSQVFVGGFTVTCHGHVLLISKTNGDLMFIAIVPDDTNPLPEPTVVAPNIAVPWRSCWAIRLRELSALLDLLRNEKPLYMALVDNQPEACAIASSFEPVGEGEV